MGYQLASLYVTVISGSLWDALEQIIKHPGYLLVFLSRSLPKVAVYFLTYVLARVGSGLPLLLLRPWTLASWPRSRNDLGPSVGHCWFGCEAPTAALVLVIGLTYSFIAPAILLARCTSASVPWSTAGFSHMFTSLNSTAGVRFGMTSSTVSSWDFSWARSLCWP